MHMDTITKHNNNTAIIYVLEALFYLYYNSVEILVVSYRHHASLNPKK
jgi:hypothetical protein